MFSAQLWYGNNPDYIENYEHNHVLRASINGDWGENLNTVAFNQNQIINKQFNYTLNSNWQTENLSLIIIVYDSVSKEILQVEKKDL